MGIRRLQFSDNLIQGVMKIDDPDRLLLDYSNKMMAWIGLGFKPRTVLVIGLGAGSIARFLLRNFSDITVDTVEIDRRVIEVCHESFFLPRSHTRLRIHQADGLQFLPEAVSRGIRWDLILVDAYGASSDDPGFGTPQFLNACAVALGADGLLMMNVIGRHSADRPHLSTLREAFGDNVRHMTATLENNVIAVACKSNLLHLTISPNLHTVNAARLLLKTELWTFQ